MSAKQRIRTLGVLFPALLLSVQAFGWGGSTHSALTTRVFDDSAVAPLLGGINQGAIENWTGEPPSALSQWASIRDRYYVESAGDEPGGYDWWDDWDETTRLKYLTHSAADCAVPVGHSPANSVYDNQLAEGSLELLVNGWSSYPDITDSGWFKHPKTKRWMKLDGKISHVMDEFEDGVIDNAAWFKSTGWYGIHTPSELEDAGSYGTSMAMMIMRVVLVDYFLSKEDPYLVPDTHPTGSAGGTILFDERDSYDPDCISWNNNATYTQIYGKKTTGMQYFLYDFDDDGDWDYTAYTDSLYYPVNSLISMGIPTNQWSQYRKASVDDEGKWVYAYDSMYLSTGVPEPASLSLLAIGGLALLRRGSGQALRRRQ